MFHRRRICGRFWSFFFWHKTYKVRNPSVWFGGLLSDLHELARGMIMALIFIRWNWVLRFYFCICWFCKVKVGPLGKFMAVGLLSLLVEGVNLVQGVLIIAIVLHLAWVLALATILLQGFGRHKFLFEAKVRELVPNLDGRAFCWLVFLHLLNHNGLLFCRFLFFRLILLLTVHKSGLVYQILILARG